LPSGAALFTGAEAATEAEKGIKAELDALKKQGPITSGDATNLQAQIDQKTKELSDAVVERKRLRATVGTLIRIYRGLP